MRFKLYNKQLHKTELYQEWQWALLKRETLLKRCQCSHNTERVNNFKDALRARISRFDYLCIFHYIYRNTKQGKQAVNETHDRNICSLGAQLQLSSA